jgi:hypothetical protein
MRKAIGTLLAALTAALPSALHAQGQPEGGWYLGSGLQLPKPRPELRIVPHPSEARDTLESSVQQVGGYRIDRYWSVDLGYVASSQSSAWTLAGSGQWSFGQSFSLQGRLGLALPATDNSIASATDALAGLASLDPAKARASLLWGLGGQYEFGSGSGLRMDFSSHYGEDAAANRARTDLWSINAFVRF